MKRIVLPILALSAFMLMGCKAPDDNPVLEIDGGKIQGVQTEKEGVYVYRGIPYAAPPVGDLRWKEPQPVVPWEGIKIADTFGNASYQEPHNPNEFYAKEFFFDGDAPFSEDCLYLNVWSNAPGETDKKLPVAMWIHGGAFLAGWGHEPEMDGQEWAAKDVVLVTINYRLGVFGFMNHPLLSEESPRKASGNYGLLDQVAALEWIRDNIAQFGGDPENVTLFGQSAGAASVKALVTSPLTEGLFNKAIIQSGGGTTKNYVMRHKDMKEMEEYTKSVMEWAGYTTLEQMRAASTEEIFEISNKYRRAKHVWTGLSNQPCIDGHVSVNHFDDAVFENKIAKVPYMIGYTTNDINELAGGIPEFCFNREDTGIPAYAYKFARPLPGDDAGAFHSSELWYVFKSLRNSWRPFTEGDYTLAERMLTAWTNFVKYADPNGPDRKEWTPYTKECPHTMVFCLDEEGNKDLSHMEDLKDSTK